MSLIPPWWAVVLLFLAMLGRGRTRKAAVEGCRVIGQGAKTGRNAQRGV